MNSYDVSRRKHKNKTLDSFVVCPRFNAEYVDVQHYEPDVDDFVTKRMKVLINQHVLQYMTTLFDSASLENSHKDGLFRSENLKFINSSVKNANYYMLDRYGIVIRKNCLDNRKSAFGWKYDENEEPLSIHISDILVKTNSKDVQILTLQSIKRQFPNVFKKPRGVFYKVYKELFEYIDVEGL